MDYYCDVCTISIKSKSKQKPFKSNRHKEVHKCKHVILSPKDIDINNIDETFYLYIIEHNKKYDKYFAKLEFKVLFNDYQCCPYVVSKLPDIKTLIPWTCWLEEVIDGLRNKAHFQSNSRNAYYHIC